MSQSLRRKASAALIVLVAGCAGRSAFVPMQAYQMSPNLPGRPTPELARVDLVPACKGQKVTKEYASGPAQALKTSGGLLCVPRFNYWGGTISYPAPTTSGNTMSLISSTTAYSGPLWPPSSPGTPIFYLQFTVNNASITFGSKVPDGAGLAGKKLQPQKAYTVFANLESGSLWMPLGECYTIAFKGKYGPAIGRVGAVFAGHNFLGADHGVIEIIPGKSVSNKC